MMGGVRCWAAAALAVVVAANGEASLWEVETETLDGKPFRFSEFEGKAAFLIVNVASQCGFTDAGYEQLEILQEDYGNRGLMVLGVPCNQFGNQEPGTADEILSFAKTKGATFQLLEKMDVNGENTHPLYRFLKGEDLDDEGCRDKDKNCEEWAASGNCETNQPFMDQACAVSCGVCDPVYEFFGDIKWNFEAFLVDDTGAVFERFRTGVDLTSDESREDIEFVLAELASNEPTEDEDEEEEEDDEGEDEDEDEDDGHEEL